MTPPLTTTPADLLREAAEGWEPGPGPFTVPLPVVNKIVNYLAAQPAPPAEALRLLRLLAFDDEPCRYDHHGHCQTHGFLDGDYRNTGCPMAEARRYLTATEEGT